MSIITRMQAFYKVYFGPCYFKLNVKIFLLLCISALSFKRSALGYLYERNSIQLLQFHNRSSHFPCKRFCRNNLKEFLYLLLFTWQKFDWLFII